MNPFLNSSIICFVFAVSGIYFIVKKRRKVKAMGTRTTETVAVITKVECVHGSGKDQYRPVFTYQVNGRNYTHTSVTADSPKRFKVGGTMRLWYDPRRPDQATLRGVTTGTISQLGLFLLLMGVLGFIAAIRQCL